MSFFDDASLVFLPSGEAGKDGKAYSMKPTDGSGDFTFSRGSNLTATRVDSNGLIEKGRENLLLQSNQFDTTWTTSNASVTGGQAGYDGSSDAWLLTSLTAADNYINQFVSSSGVQTYSVYAKAGTAAGIWIQLRTGNYPYLKVNLTNGTFIAKHSSVISYEIKDVGNGWYRVSFAANNSNIQARIKVCDASGSALVAGNIYIQDAQLEQGLVATEYIESGATTGLAGILEDSPRFDYSGGASCPSLLLEPSRTQLAQQSEFFEGSEYSNASSTLTTNAETSPEGLQNATTLETTGTFAQIRMVSFGALSAGNQTLSVFAKYESSQYIILRNRNFTGGTNSQVWFDIQNGIKGGSTGDTPIDYDIEDYGNGWYRCYLVFNADAADLAGEIYLYNSNTDGSYNTGIGDTSIIWGFQLEEGSYPTSYIPNHSGGSVTREADDCGGAGTSSTFNATEGVFYAEISTNSDGTDKAISLNNGVAGSLNNRLWMGYSTSNKRVYALGYVNNSFQFALNKLMTDESLFVKIACRYKRDDIAFFVNGEKVGTDTSAINFTELTRLDFNIGTGVSGASALYGNVKQVLVFNSYLSDSECITLTS